MYVCMYVFQLFQLLESKTRMFSESVIQEFRQLYDIIVISPQTIEKVAEMRGNEQICLFFCALFFVNYWFLLMYLCMYVWLEFFSTLQLKIDVLSDRIVKNDSHFALMEAVCNMYVCMYMCWSYQYI